MADTQFKLESDSPVQPDLLFWQLVGVESLSRPSRYMLTVLSRKRQINPDDVLGKSFTVVLEFHDEGGGAHKRHYQGYATRFRRVGDAGERLCMYQLELDSWFSLLQHRTNARIFQDKMPDEVIKDVLLDSKIRTVANLELAGLREPHPTRRYCVQYLESDFDFLSRLMEHEGIYYWFDNADNGDGKKMMLADNVSVHEKLPVESQLDYAAERTAGETRYNEIEEWWSERSLQSGRAELADRDFKKIRSKIGHKVEFQAPHDHSDYEVYEFPGGFFDQDEAKRTATLRADERVARNEACWASTTWPDVAVGRIFALRGHTDPAMNQEWLITRCLLVMSHPGYEGVSVDTRAQDVLTAQFLAQAMAPLGVWAGIDRKLDAHVRNRANHAYLIEVAPANASYRPPRVTPRLQMTSPHTAIVVGPKGEEIHMDEFGRVKVQFHWDRYGEENEKSTAWIRVSQPWAGQSWGGQFIPRIGQEVIVDFLYGDPDRPIIVGRVYNDDQPITYTSPTQSGIKTRSSPGGGPNNFNEIMFEDKKGNELLKLHAEKNMSTSVEHNDSTSVGNDQSIAVENDRSKQVRGFETNTIGKNQTDTVKGDQFNTINGNQQNTVGANRTSQIGGVEQITVGANRIETVGGSANLIVTGEHGEMSANRRLVTGNLEVGISTLALVASGDVTMKANAQTDAAGTKRWIGAGTDLKLVAGTTLSMISNAAIEAVSVDSNTTVLGNNSSGHIGMSSSTQLGMKRDACVGMSMQSALALSVSNFLGVNLENTAGAKVSNSATVNFEASLFKTVTSAMELHVAGAGGAAAGAAGAVAGILGVVALAAAAYDVNATLQQYRDAEQSLADAAAEANAMGMSTLAQNLTSLSNRARNTRLAGAAGVGAAAAVATAPLGGVGVLGVAVAGGGAALAESYRSPSEPDPASPSAAAGAAGAAGAAAGGAGAAGAGGAGAAGAAGGQEYGAEPQG